MIQTTLFNYFTCNGTIPQTVNKVHSLKQVNLTDYYNIIPKNKNRILNYFKPKDKEEKESKEKVFDLVLVDIKNTFKYYSTSCIKKNMYDPDLKYIAMSYRWGELNEQVVQTPDYTAHITSFALWHLYMICQCILTEPDLYKIPYIWIDAISIDQQNKEAKKDTVLKMNQIYQNATYILAVPDLHLEYLLKHPLNKEIINSYIGDKETVYNDIFNMRSSSTNSLNNDIKRLIATNSKQQQKSFIQKSKTKKTTKKIKKDKDINKDQKLKNLYQFLAYLINDWSNRAWVISEYHIAKEKYVRNGTPLKYMFISLIVPPVEPDYIIQPFFSYHFNDDNDDQQNTIDSNVLTPKEINNSILFHQFVKSRFMQRSHLDMILNSNASRNEDRLNAILPTWNKYKHLIKNKDTISNWNITDMISIRLKLYELMYDLWDKATLLNACSRIEEEPILPSFASQYDGDMLMLVEKYNYNSTDYKRLEESLLGTIKRKYEKEAIQIEKFMDECKKSSKPIWTENLTSILLDHQHCYLSVNANSYFIKKEVSDNNNYIRMKLSLNDHDEIQCVFLPFFTFNLPGYINYRYIYLHGSSIYLVGNKEKNKWLSFYGYSLGYESEHFCSDNYTFNIY